jgi:hypothetical protein
MDAIKKLEMAVFNPVQFFSLDETRQEITKVVKVISSTTSFINDLKIYEVAEPLRQLIRNLGQIVAIYNIVFIVPDIIANVRKALSTDKLLSRCKAIIRSVVSSAAVASVAASLAGVGGVAARVLFPLAIVDTAMNLNKMRKNKLFYDELRGKVQDQTYLFRNRKRIAKKLKFKVQTNDVNQAQKLESCINSKERFGMANSALKVAGVVVGGLSLLTPASPVTLGLAAGTAIAGLALFKVEQLSK